jgi:ornithine cyclodeaminase
VTVPFVTGEELEALLPMGAAIDALAAAFVGEAAPEGPPRSHLETVDGDLLLMAAFGPEGVGVKLVTVNLDNPARGLPLVHAVYVVFAAGTMAPAAVVDGSALTGLRTGAVSGLATRHLAREDAHRLVIFGAGVQARSHLEAMRAVRPVDEVVVVSRSRGPAEALAARARDLGLEAGVGAPDAVAWADLICACTTSATPVFDGAAVPAGAHVNAVGSYRPERREVDDTLVRRARIVVETRESALAEAGDLSIPLGSGTIGPDAVVADLREVVRGEVRGRQSEEDVTLFKSVGVAFEDLAVAAAALAART